jgi:hypothetical protein
MGKHTEVLCVNVLRLTGDYVYLQSSSFANGISDNLEQKGNFPNDKNYAYENRKSKENKRTHRNFPTPAAVAKHTGAFTAPFLLETMNSYDG